MVALTTQRQQTSQMRVKRLGVCAYTPVWRAMQSFTERRNTGTADELWLLEHPRVFTLGRNARREHLHDTRDIPVVRVDRGGQVTYHGPGQLVAYTLLDLDRRGLGIKSLVRLLEQAVIDLLADYRVTARRRDGAPGVYVEGRKIAALGLRVKQGRAFHGMSLNVDMDLTPFTMINPCGYPGLEVTRMSDLGIEASVPEITHQFRGHFERMLNTTSQ